MELQEGIRDSSPDGSALKHELSKSYGSGGDFPGYFGLCFKIADIVLGNARNAAGDIKGDYRIFGK